jgi:succinyl-diaminopimelate desuccinylase
MKGAIRAVVKVRGKMAHGCTPLLGINPNTRLARIILAFEDYEKR